MRLTNNLRDSFVRAALDDLPSTDHYEQASKIILAAAENALPPKVLEVYKKFPEYFVKAYTSYNGFSVTVPVIDENRSTFLNSKDKDALNVLRDASKAQLVLKNTLATKLRAVAYSCNTLKSLKEALPAFEKYMTTGLPAASTNLPIMYDVTKAFKDAGWPKGQLEKAA